MNKKYVDTPSIVQVLGGLYKNPKLLDNEEYFFDISDFVEEFHKILFTSIYNLHALGAEEINLTTIEDYLEQRPKKLATFRAYKGGEYLNKLESNTQIAAFDYYYNRVKKMTLLRAYANYGLDLKWLYDPDCLDIKTKQQQEDWLDNTNLSDMMDEIEKGITNIRLKYSTGADYSLKDAGDGILELIDHLKEEPDIGIPLFGEMFNGVCMGARLGKFYLRSAATGVGKALPNSTTLPTPCGLKTVGEIKVGDYLFDAFGKPTRVKAIYPQGEKEVWEITFKDGRKAKCCEEHLWSFCTEGQRKEQKLNRKFYTKTLKEINKMDLYQKGHGYKILVPMQKAVEYSSKQYYLTPYVFGLLLGDGSFRYSSVNKGLCFSSENEELPSIIAKEMGWKYKKCSKYNYSWMFEDLNNNEHTNVWVEEALKDFPALWQTKSEMKYIPRKYLEGSVEQRFDLLNGLLDTDGSVDKEKGRVSFYTTSEQLRDDVIELSLSLGFKATWLKDNHKKESLPIYKIEIAGTPEDKIKLFKLKRKHDLILSWYNNGKRKENNLFNPIIDIKKLDYSEEMTCFYVDNEEHLFLMNDFIVTHNTRSMIADVCSIGCKEIFDPAAQQWKVNNFSEPTLYITTEQELSEVQTMMLAFVSGVNEDCIKYNRYHNPQEIERVVKAGKIIKESGIKVKELPDFSLEDIENVIKQAVINYDIHYCFHDYIHTSIKILSEISTRAKVKNLREDNILFMISVKLKELCQKYNLFIMSSTQLSNDYKTASVYDQSLLRGAKSLADKVDWGGIMLQTTPEDLESVKDIINKGGFEKPAIKMSIYKNRGCKYKDILLWCKEDRGTCRITPMFATDYSYKIVDIEKLNIEVE